MSKSKPRFSKLRVIVFSILAAFLLLFIISWGGGRLILYSGKMYFLHKMTDEERAAYEEWVSVPVTLPPEALRAEPFRAETRAASDALAAAWTKHADAATTLTDQFHSPPEANGPYGTPAARRALFAKLDEHHPLIEKFERLVAQPDYSIMAFPSKSDEFSLAMFRPDFTAMRVIYRLAEMNAWRCIDEGDYAQAANYSELLVRASRAERYVDFLYHSYGSIILNVGVACWARAIDECGNVDLLKESLKKQTALAQDLPMLPMQLSIDVLGNVAWNRNFLRYGVTADVQGKTGEEIYIAVQNAEIEFVEKVILPSLDSGIKKDEWKAYIQKKRIPEPESSGERRKQELERLAMFPNLHYINPEKFHLHYRKYWLDFDLLIAETARKIFVLERGREPEAAEELLGGDGLSETGLGELGLSEIPADRFSPAGAPLRLSERGYFYSVGPDGEDQRGEVKYDSRNGLESKGDIWLEQFENRE